MRGRRACYATVPGLKVNPHHRDEERWQSGCGLVPDKAGTSDQRLPRVIPRLGQRRSGGEVPAGQGLQAALRLAAFLGAGHRTPDAGDTVLSVSGQRRRYRRVNHLCEVTAFHLPGGELWIVATARAPGPTRATPSGKGAARGVLVGPTKRRARPFGCEKVPLP
jgi:hypothetical protein